MEGTDSWRANRIEQDIRELKDICKENGEASTKSKITNYEILMATKLLKESLEEVTKDVQEIKERPIKTYEKLSGAILLFVVTNVLMFLWTIFQKAIMGTP